MSKNKSTIWEIEPHTLAKHEILRRYLGAWFAVLGSKIPRIVYLDGFCGPGMYQGGEPGSPIIALDVAKGLESRIPNTEIVFFFIDERSDRLNHLQKQIDGRDLPQNFRILTHAGEFQETIADLFDSMKAGRSLAPTFAFIDPFGFKGIPFDLVSRLLQNSRTEVFINIMIDHINRFVESPDAQIQQHIVDLFGTEEVLDIIQNSPDRFMALRELYQRQLKKVARIVRFFEMRDKRHRPIYYLFFATNHPLGHSKMKEAFWKADPQSGYSFSDATNPDQPFLLKLDPSDSLARDLMARYANSTIDTESIRRYVEDETPFVAGHMKSALKILESEDRICPNPIKQDGKPRRKGTFPDGVNIRF